MVFTERKRRKGSLLLVFCFVIAGLLTGLFPVSSPPSAASAAREPQAVNHTQKAELMSVALSSTGTVEKSYVYDENENKLMYNRVTGMVFSTAGVVYTQDSQPLTYDDETEQFEDSLQRRLDLVERSTGGLQNYYLMFGNYKVRSIGIHDELYLVGIAANTAFNKGAAYDMLITRVYVSPTWWQYFLGQRGYYEYYDLHGHKIDSKYLQHTVRPNLIAGAGTSAFGGTVLTKFEKWGTILDLLDEIIFLMELVPPTGSPMGEFALNTVTGAYLRDDRAQKIRINDTGQLIDPMGWPLIGADARPLWWRESLRAYTDNKGELLEYGAENTLTDKNGFVAHSVISNVIAGTRIYLIYLADGKTLIPATLKTISTDPYKAEYYDMNGNKIELDEIVEPEISVDDRKENWPEEFQTWWDEVKAVFAAIWNFIKQWGLLILLGLIFIITLPLTLPILMILLQLLFKGLSAVFKGILTILTFPFRIFKKDD